jgi:hypothetical protein
MGEAGKRKVEENYTWDQIARRTEHVYTTVLDRLETGSV